MPAAKHSRMGMVAWIGGAVWTVSPWCLVRALTLSRLPHLWIRLAPQCRQTMATPATVFFGYWRSSCSYRVRIALAWKRIGYEYKAVDLMKDGGEQFTQEFTKINPNQRLPAMQIDGHVLSQSGAILEYIEETRPQRPLLPQDAYLRAQVRNICLLIGADTQPLQSITVSNKAVESLPESEKSAGKMEWGRFWVHRSFVGLEQLLARTAGTYCVGDSVTLADLYLGPQVFNAKVLGVDMAQFPIISRIADTLAELPEFKAAHPSQQPDAP